MQLQSHSSSLTPSAIEKDLKEQIEDNLTYKDYVDMGKELVKRTEMYQARLAFYACRVCQIRHGGKSEKYYTLSDYADAIGINRKTLQQWTLAYRNVLQKLDIPLDQVTKEVWRAANRVNDRMTWQNRLDNKEGGTPRRAMKYKMDYPTEDIRKMFAEEQDDQPSLASEVRAWGAYVRQMKNNMFKRDLNLVHEGNLIEIMNTLDEMSDHLNAFLTAKKKKKK